MVINFQLQGVFFVVCGAAATADFHILLFLLASKNRKSTLDACKLVNIKYFSGLVRGEKSEYENTNFNN